MKSRQQARWEPGGLLGPLLAPPHSRYTLWRCALAPAILSECMYFLAGFLTENREGGELETSVFGASLSPPTTGDTSTGGDKLSPPLQAAGADSLPLWFSGSVCGEAGAAPGAHLPFRNIIPRQFRVPEGEGATGRGGDENRGRRFQPGSSSPTQRLPRTARGGG